MTIDSATIRKFRIGPSIRIESRIGRTIRNRIESRSFAGPYLIGMLMLFCGHSLGGHSKRWSPASIRPSVCLSHVSHKLESRADPNYSLRWQSAVLLCRRSWRPSGPQCSPFYYNISGKQVSVHREWIRDVLSTHWIYNDIHSLHNWLIWILICTELKWHWRLFVLVYSFLYFFWPRVLDKAEYSAFESTLNSSIVSYHTCLFTYLPMTVYDCVRCREWSRRLHTSTRRSRMSSYLHQRSTANRYLPLLMIYDYRYRLLWRMFLLPCSFAECFFFSVINSLRRHDVSSALYAVHSTVLWCYHARVNLVINFALWTVRSLGLGKRGRGAGCAVYMNPPSLILSLLFVGEFFAQK